MFTSRECEFQCIKEVFAYLLTAQMYASSPVVSRYAHIDDSAIQEVKRLITALFYEMATTESNFRGPHKIGDFHMRDDGIDCGSEPQGIVVQ